MDERQKHAHQNQPQHTGPKPNQLPSRKSVEEAIRVIETFRDICRHQMDLGYWATVDFPSKHHISKILQMKYRNPADIRAFYGDGLARHIEEVMKVCEAYRAFLKDPNEIGEKKA